MADNISKITLPNNVEYDLKDATARSDLLMLNANKQDILVSGTNIKTINNESLLGSGNITIQGGGGGDSLPDQTGHAGDYLTTDGINVSWGDAESTSTIDIDTTVSPNSDHLITSGAVATAISNIDVLPSQTGNSGKVLTTNGSEASWASVPEEVFIATYGTTNYATVDAAVTEGKLVVARNGNLSALLVEKNNNTGTYYFRGAGTGSDNIIARFQVTSDSAWASTNTTLITTSRKINNKALSSDITLDASDVGAAASSHTHGNIQNNGTLQTTDVTVANGDKLVVTDADATTANQVARASISFDGSTTSKYLSPKGTWENVPTVSYPVTSVNTKTGAVVLDNTDVGAAATSHAHGNIQSGGTLQTSDVSVGNGDKLVVTDSSDSNKVARTSVSFDGSTTNKYLSPKGTWENVPTVNYPVTSVNTKTGAVVLDNTDVGAAATSHSHGNITSGGDITATAPTIANGDQIVINDNSASKITNGPTFDGSTTSKYLSQKGTWESVPVTSVNTKTGAVVLDNTDVGAAATSHAHGNITSGGDITATAPTIANGDQIVINDNSESKITNGPTFDGNTTNKYLSPKGTWENIPSVPSPADATPIMDGTAAIGTSTDYAREDHVHPTDTSLQTKITVSGVLKGDGSGGVSAATAGIDYQAPLPSQTNNSGKYLTTNGSALSWGTVDALPSQTGNSGKYLTTNGTAASWAATSAASTLTIESTPTSGSSNVVSSGGIYTAINNKVNRTTAVNVADVNYTTLMARGVKLLDATTYDAVSDWSVHLVNGAIAWRYE